MQRLPVLIVESCKATKANKKVNKKANKKAKAKINAKRKVVGPFDRLPDELMLLVMGHMSNPSIVALSYTCSRFYRISTRVVENIFDRTCYPTESEKRLQDQTEFRRLMASKVPLVEQVSSSNTVEQTAKKPIVQYKCVKCNKSNREQGASFFSLGALRGPAEQRQCLFHEGRLWICPSNIWDYTKAKRLCRDIFCDNLIKPVYHGRAAVSGLCQCGNHFLYLSAATLIQAIPLFCTVMRDPTDTELDLVKINLARSPLRLCPHINDRCTKLSHRFSANCKRECNAPRSSCSCSTCAREGDTDLVCSQCETSFQFRWRRDRKTPTGTTHSFYILTRRTLFSSVEDKGQREQNSKQTWLGQISIPSEFPGLTEEWKRAWGTDTGKGAEPPFEDDPFAEGFYW